MNYKRYETRPLECWQKAKELIGTYYREVATAKAEGKLLVSGGSSSMVVLPAGLGEYVFWGAEPYGAVIASNPEFSLQCAEAAESVGFARDLCSYMRNYWGSMILNRYYFGGQFPRPDFCYTVNFCDSHAKWFQWVAEYMRVPFFGVDFPLIPIEYGRKQQRVDYLVGQLYDAIEWMEKVTGREYDDEALIEAVQNECEALAIMGEISLLQQAIPAPLSQKSMFSIFIIPHLIGHRREGIEFCRQVRDELRYRVANKLAALATERCRLMDDAQPPWYLLQLYRYLEQYGAVVIGSHYSFFLGGNLVQDKDGTLVAPRTLEERGLKLRTRDDALKAMAEFYLEKPIMPCFTSTEYKSQMMLSMVKQWHVDGVILHLNRGCEGVTQGVLENRLFLLNAGVPVMTYEGNMGDKRECNEAEVLDRLESFMESLGLSKLEG